MANQWAISSFSCALLCVRPWISRDHFRAAAAQARHFPNALHGRRVRPRPGICAEARPAGPGTFPLPREWKNAADRRIPLRIFPPVSERVDHTTRMSRFFQHADDIVGRGFAALAQDGRSTAGGSARFPRRVKRGFAELPRDSQNQSFLCVLELRMPSRSRSSSVKMSSVESRVRWPRVRVESAVVCSMRRRRATLRLCSSSVRLKKWPPSLLATK